MLSSGDDFDLLAAVVGQARPERVRCTQPHPLPRPWLFLGRQTGMPDDHTPTQPAVSNEAADVAGLRRA